MPKTLPEPPALTAAAEDRLRSLIYQQYGPQTPHYTIKPIAHGRTRRYRISFFTDQDRCRRVSSFALAVRPRGEDFELLEIERDRPYR